MDMFRIQGGAPLTGRVSVSGSKNATLPIMAAALAADGETLLDNVPDLADVRTLSALLQSLGMSVQTRPEGSLALQVVDSSRSHASYQLVRQMRASICVLGPLLARRGVACVSLPGGCNIGHRPIDLHLKGLAALGAEIDVRAGNVFATAKQLRGTSIFLGGVNGSTVTGTCNVMTAATLARGTTVITAAACEPEVVALAEALNQMGARIFGHGTPRIEIEGVTELSGTRLQMIPDRIEAATLLIAAAATRGQVTLEQVQPDHLIAVLDLLNEMGCSLSAAGESITLNANGSLRPIDFTALPYPGIPTDVQAQLMTLASVVPGTTLIRDHVFPDRFLHVAELCRMGAQIRQQTGASIVTGISSLSGAEVMASDLRASAALVLAGLVARGTTTIHRISHLDRGYEQLEKKLGQLGAHVERRLESQSVELSLVGDGEPGILESGRDEAAFSTRKSA